MENNYSLSDLGAVVNGGNGFAGNGLIWIIVLALFLGGGFGFNRGGDYGQFATAASQQEILFGQRFQSLDNKMDRLGNGIADATYALNNAITGEGRALQSQVAANKYDLATAIHAEGEATRAMLQQNKIESLQGQINQLQLQNAMCGVVRYPMQSSYYAPNPFCQCGNNGCGCNNI